MRSSKWSQPTQTANFDYVSNSEQLELRNSKYVPLTADNRAYSFGVK